MAVVAGERWDDIDGDTVCVWTDPEAGTRWVWVGVFQGAGRGGPCSDGPGEVRDLFESGEVSGSEGECGGGFSVNHEWTLMDTNAEQIRPGHKHHTKFGFGDELWHLTTGDKGRVIGILLRPGGAPVYYMVFQDSRQEETCLEFELTDEPVVKV